MSPSLVTSRLPGDELCLSSGDAGHSPHDLLDVCGAVVEVIADGGVLEDPSDVFHGVRSVVGRQRSGFPDWVDVADIAQRRRRRACDLRDAFVDLLVAASKSGLRWVFALNVVVLVSHRVVRPGRTESGRQAAGPAAESP